MIFFLHESKHIGGGQSYVQAYIKVLNELHVKFDFFEDSINRKAVKNILLRKYHKAFLHLYSPKYLPLMFLLKILGVPVVLTVYGIWFLESKNQNPQQSYKEIIWLKITQGIILLLSNTLIALSAYEKELLIRNFRFIKNKIVIIPAIVDSRSFHPVSQDVKQKIRKKLHLPLESTIFLVLSRLEKRKGIDLAIQAFGRLLQKYTNCFLCVVFPVGRYTYFNVLTECFEQIAILGKGEKIHFITGVNSKNIPLFFQASDVFLMSSTDLETFGLTTLEAAASGCLPVGFQSGATPELLCQIDRNLVASPVSSKSLAQRMSWTISLSKCKRHQLQQKCLDVSQNYSWRKLDKGLYKILV